MDAGTALGDEAMEEPAVVPGGLERLEVAAALVAPVPEPVFVGGHAERRAPAELAGQDRLGVGKTRYGNRDVVEQNRAHRARTGRRSSSARSARNRSRRRAPAR